MSSLQLDKTIANYYSTVKKIIELIDNYLSNGTITDELEKFFLYGANTFVAKTLKEVSENRSADPTRADVFITIVAIVAKKLEKAHDAYIKTIPLDTPFYIEKDNVYVSRYSSGTFYVGEMTNGWMHGHGYVKWSNNDTYVGSFKNGGRDGKGLMTYANGDTHEGKWREGRKHGKGHQIVSGVKTYGVWTHNLMTM